MDGTIKRPLARITIEWDPNTGALNLDGNGANAMEQVGMLNWASLAVIQSAQPRHEKRIIEPPMGARLA